MTALIELAGNLALLKSQIDEVDPEMLNDTIESVEAVFTDKVEWLIGITKEYQSIVDACKAEEKRLADRRRSFEKKVEGIKDYVRDTMVHADMKKLNYKLFTVSVQLNPPAVKLLDEMEIPLDYKITTITETIDKKAILEAIKAGDTVPGATIEQGQSLRIK